MGKAKSKGKHRLDKYYHLAKEQGYRSRAAFKLIQINRKYQFLENCRSLLDLCAAPGGWLQVAVKTMPVSSLIVGVDLDPIRSVRGAKTLVGDITTQKCRAELKKAAGGGMMDAVICDGAPNVGGAWASEAYSQAWLILEALKLATEFLVPRGTFVTKVFRSKDYNALLYAFKQLFDKVEATKPAASRNTSAEIFVVCQGYKAPSKIDPRLLDAKYLFQEVQEAPRSMGPDALLKAKVKQKRWREGYAEGLSTTHRAASAAAFLASEQPVEELGRYTQFVLEGPASELVPGPDGADQAAADVAQAIRQHPATTPEVRALLGDLQVLGRNEFKQLLKWRLVVKKALVGAKEAAQGKEEEAEEQAEADEEGADKAAEEGEAALLAEMAAVREAMEKRMKRERKKKREQKKKARIRAAQLALGEGIAEGEDEALFSLAGIRGGLSAAAALGEAGAMDEAEMEEVAAPSSGDDPAAAPATDSDAGSDEEKRRYDEMTEEALDDAYEQYKQRQGLRKAAAERRKRRRLGMAGELGSGDEEGTDMPGSAPGSDDEQEGEEGAGLLVRLEEGRAGRPATQAALAAQWFSQDLFQDPNLLADEDEAPQRHQPPRKPRTAPAAAAAKLGVPAATDVPGQNGGASGLSFKQQSSTAAGQGRGDFEEVPMAATDSDSDSDSAAASMSGGESSDDGMAGLDDQGKAEVLALAKRMLQRKERDAIIEGGYNKYAFHDASLPKWFYEDERRHFRAVEVVSREEVEEEKARLRAIDSRPIKKVAEAKARKRKRLQTKLSAARQKAEAISAQEDVPMKSKMREIEKLYAKARAAGAGKGKKGKQTRSAEYKSKKKGPPLDGRMRADKRQVDSKRKLAAKKKKGKGGGGAKGKGDGGAKGKGQRGR